jgi:hypothetical protein
MLTHVRRAAAHGLAGLTVVYIVVTLGSFSGGGDLRLLGANIDVTESATQPRLLELTFEPLGVAIAWLAASGIAFACQLPGSRRRTMPGSSHQPSS